MVSSSHTQVRSASFALPSCMITCRSHARLGTFGVCIRADWIFGFITLPTAPTRRVVPAAWVRLALTLSLALYVAFKVIGEALAFGVMGEAPGI